LQKTITIPEDHLDMCQKQNIATKGNAAANAVNFLDLTGENEPPPQLPSG
jgi:iron transport multicopper oxidase